MIFAIKAFGNSTSPMNRTIRKFLIHTLAFTAVLFGVSMMAGNTALAQNQGYDVFVPIAKYMSQGDSESLSAWFADNLEITVTGGTSDSSRSQAKQILKTFFSKSVPTTFNIEHTAARGNMKYALGTMTCGAENYMVTIFVSYQNKGYKIQQLKIEKAK